MENFGRGGSCTGPGEGLNVIYPHESQIFLNTFEHLLISNSPKIEKFGLH